MLLVSDEYPLAAPRFCWFLTLSYVVVLLLANWFDVRLVQLGPWVSDTGTLLFPLGALCLTMCGIKVMIELLGLPLSLCCVKRLKQKEQLDIYDDHTRFTLFQFIIHYRQANNHYHLTSLTEVEP